MNLTWIERPIELWGRTRDCHESHVMGGVYRVGKIEFEKEGEFLRFHLTTCGANYWGVCYRASFAPIVDAEDTVMPRPSATSYYFRTLEEGKAWCQDLEDRYQEWLKQPHPPAGMENAK